MRFERSSNRSERGLLPRSLRAVPGDLTILVGLLLVVNVWFRIPGLQGLSIAGARLWTLLAIPLVVFVPGYVLLAILFPGRGDRPANDREHSFPRDPRTIDSLDLVERAALSFGMSVALVPLFALVVGNVWGYDPGIVLTALTVGLLVGIALAVVQRLRCAPSNRFTIPVRRWSREFHEATFRPDNAIDAAATVALAVGVLLAVGAIGYAVATPYQSGASSTLYLVTENETGTEIAADYPTEFTAGQSRALTVGVKNDEEQRQAYTILVTLEEVRTDGGQATVTATRELDRLSTVVPAGETWTSTHSVAPTLEGENLRLHYALYRGAEAPADPASASAYRDAYLWINVSAA